jgi:NTE family protein
MRPRYARFTPVERWLGALVLTCVALAPVARAQADPSPPTTLLPTAETPRVALALGGGAARGAAHIGVIRVLNEAGVPIDLILGTSMGSLVGGLYAAGFEIDVVADIFERIEPASAAELLVPPRGGLLDGRPLAILLDGLLEGRTVDDTAIPFHAVVTDLETGEPRTAPGRSLSDAIRASSAIPALFDPVELDGRFYFDGGLKRNVPASQARALGATYVVGVDITRESPFDPSSVQSNLSRIFFDIIEGFTEVEREAVDVLLQPDLDATYMAFDRTEEFALAGERAAREALPRILADLAARGIELRAPGDPNAGRLINIGWEARLAAARRAVTMRPRPWNLNFDLALAPAAHGERLTPSPVPAASRVRFGVDLRDGPLGRASVGVGYAFSLTGGSDAVTMRASWRATYALEPFVDAQFDGANGGIGRLGLRVHVDPGWSFEGALRVPGPVVETAAGWRGTGLWADGGAVLGLGPEWGRGHAEVRAAIAPFSPSPEPILTLRARLLGGAATSETPPGERFSVGPATGLRTLPPDAYAATRLVTGSLELALRLHASQPVFETALVTPSLWVFVDGAVFESTTGSGSAWGTGVGVGVEGALFGFVPFDVGIDVGYGLPTRSWRAAVRAGPSFPAPWRP